MNWWLFFIILHATSGLVGFATGVALLSPNLFKRKPWILPVFVGSMVSLIIFMISAMIAHWTEIELNEKIIFTGLVFLAAYMLYRAIKARRKLLQAHTPIGYIDDVGFPLIALFNGFIIVALIDLNAPIWLVIVSAIAATVVGSKWIKRTKAKL